MPTGVVWARTRVQIGDSFEVADDSITIPASALERDPLLDLDHPKNVEARKAYDDFLKRTKQASLQAEKRAKQAADGIGTKPETGALF